jgi:hypothetical protein
VNGREFSEHAGIAHGTIKRYLHEGMPAIRRAQSREVVIEAASAIAWIENRYPRALSVHRTSVVYFVQRSSDEAIKIGFTSDMERRLRELRKGASAVQLLAAIPGSKPSELALHDRFSVDRIDPNDEWFRPSEALRKLVASIGSVAA